MNQYKMIFLLSAVIAAIFITLSCYPIAEAGPDVVTFVSPDRHASVVFTDKLYSQLVSSSTANLVSLTAKTWLDAADQNDSYTWEKSDPFGVIATITPNAKGDGVTVTTKQGALGDAIIYATSTNENFLDLSTNYKAMAEFTVSAREMHISIPTDDKATPDIALGESLRMIAYLEGANNSHAHLADGPNGKVTWAVNNSTGIIADPTTGFLTTTGTSGETTVNVQHRSVQSLTAVQAVNVVASGDRIEFANTDGVRIMSPTETFQIGASAIPASPKPTFALSSTHTDTGAVSVTSTGLVTALKIGDAFIEARTPTASAIFQVHVVNLSIEGDSFIGIGALGDRSGHTPFKAIQKSASGTTDVTNSVIWSLSSETPDLLSAFKIDNGVLTTTTDGSVTSGDLKVVARLPNGGFFADKKVTIIKTTFFPD